MQLQGIGFLFEVFSNQLVVLDHFYLVYFLLLLQLPAGLELGAGGPLVTQQVIGTPVGMAYTLHPAITSLHLSIPAVLGIMCHFIAHVLSEPQVLRGKP